MLTVLHKSVCLPTQQSKASVNERQVRGGNVWARSHDRVRACSLSKAKGPYSSSHPAGAREIWTDQKIHCPSMYNVSIEIKQLCSLEIELNIH